MSETRKSWWVDYVNNQASKDELSQTCRPDVSILDFSVMINDLRKKIPDGRKLLDIGAGNGLIDILIEDKFDNIIAIEPAEATYKVLKENVKLFPGILPVRCFAEDIAKHIGTVKFDRLLIYAVAEEFSSLFETLKIIIPHLEEKAHILIGSINNKQCREGYLEELPSILEKKGFNEEDIKRIMDKNFRAVYYEFDELRSFFLEQGFFAKKVPTYPLHNNFSIKFDLIASR